MTLTPVRIRPDDPPRTVTVAKPRDPAVERLRLAAVMLALTLAVFAQATGNAAADTKIDLVISPWRFLGRATQLWDPIGGAGQLQNQAYGYLFPIGPFYGVLHGLGIAPWEVQRAFEATILCAAFLGTYRLARRMGVRQFWAAVGAGLVYALAPRTLSELSSISAELMPMAALPWIMLPLVGGAQRGSPRKAAARSGIALLFAGGVNAAATLAVLPMPLLWLMTRGRGPRRHRLFGWWILAVALACLWWALPLLVLGKYSPPFLNWIETSSVTTEPTALLSSIRGADHWESYLGPGIWPAGWIFVATPAIIVATTVVAGLGLVGLSLRATPHRAFLWATLFVGLILVTAGHRADVGPVGAGEVRSLLDGVLTPFRNVHKFDPLIRLPIALGVGQLLSKVRVPASIGFSRRSGTYRLPVRLLLALAVIGVGAVAAAPVWTNHVVSSQRVTAEPSWWQRAANWVAANGHGARTLVVPGTGAPEYLWGGTVDNAMQPVAVSPWTVRDGVPLTQPGYIRLLDSIDAIVAEGRGDARLAPLLARAGIGYVAMANDLDSRASSTTSLAYVRGTLERSPGLTLRASFGPPLGGSFLPTDLVDGAPQAPAAVQVYSVAGWSGMVGLDPLSGAVAATGSADTLPTLVGRGLGADRAVLYGPDALGLPVATTVTTDGIRKSEASFAGSVSQSVTMTASQQYSQQRQVHDYLPPHAGPLSAYHYVGITDVHASSAGTDNWAFVNRGDLNGPWSALDGDRSSAWQSTGGSAVGQWLQTELVRPSTARHVDIAFAIPDTPPASLPTRVTVTTDAGSVVEPVRPVTSLQRITLPAGTWRRLRITVDATSQLSANSSVAIASLQIPGVRPARYLQVPAAAGSAMYAFDARSGYRSACLPLAAATACDEAYAASGQEDSGIDRSFTTTTGGTYTIGTTVRLRPGPALNRLLAAGTAVRTWASSALTTDPRRRSGAAVDGDTSTSWQAAPGDIHPRLTLVLPTLSEITGVHIVRSTDPLVAGPARITVTAGIRKWSGTLPASGDVRFALPAFARRVRIRIDEAQLRASLNTVTSQRSLLTPGLAEVTIDGQPAATPSPELVVPCSAGLAVSIDGRSHALSITAPRSAVLAGDPVVALPCTGPDEISLPPGAHRVSLDANPVAIPVSLTLSKPGVDLASVAAGGRVSVRSWGATDRTVQVDTAAAALLVVHENFNAGWQATLNGHRLRAVQVDGWQQAFVVPAGSHGLVHVEFAPQRYFLIGLVAGALGIAALIVLAVRRRRVEPMLPPLRASGWRARWAVVGIGAAAVLLAGWTGLAMAAAVAGFGLLVGRRAATVLAWMSGGLLTVSALISVRGPEVGILLRPNTSVVQLLCVTALVSGALAAVAGGVDARRRRGV